jgi:hypothetical protein
VIRNFDCKLFLEFVIKIMVSVIATWMAKYALGMYKVNFRNYMLAYHPKLHTISQNNQFPIAGGRRRDIWVWQLLKTKMLMFLFVNPSQQVCHNNRQQLILSQQIPTHQNQRSNSSSNCSNNN